MYHRCAVPFDPVCANSRLFNTSGKRFRAGLAIGKSLILQCDCSQSKLFLELLVQGAGELKIVSSTNSGLTTRLSFRYLSPTSHWLAHDLIVEATDPGQQAARNIPWVNSRHVALLDWLLPSKFFLNLDNEETGTICIGCARNCISACFSDERICRPSCWKKSPARSG